MPNRKEENRALIENVIKLQTIVGSNPKISSFVTDQGKADYIIGEVDKLLGGLQKKYEKNPDLYKHLHEKYFSKVYRDFFSPKSDIITLDNCKLKSLSCINFQKEKFENKQSLNTSIKFDFFSVFLGFEGFLDAMKYDFDINKKRQGLIGDENNERESNNGEKLSIDFIANYPDFPKEAQNDPNVHLVKESALFHKKKKHKNIPLFIHKNHLDDKKMWENWAFSITALMRNSIKVQCLEVGNRNHFQLQLNLENENYGVYNNLGKKFLEDYFIKGRMSQKLALFSENLTTFLKGQEMKTIMEERVLPLRWASGGALPIVNYKQKKWVLLFFRDIAPIGWNVANGASENELEKNRLNTMIFREFAEEVCVFSSNPYNQEYPFIVQKRFYKSDWVNQDPLRSESFYKKQHTLRASQDKLQLHFTDTSSERIKVKTLETPFSVKVDNNVTEDVLFTVNPYEFGIEILRILKFDLKDTDYILDGEMHESETFLLRRPIMLLSTDYLKEVYQKEGGLGVLTNNAQSMESKKLDRIPKEAFMIFNSDMKAKQNRLKQIQNKSSLEADFYKKWLEAHQVEFLKIVDENEKPSADITNANTWLNHLCPVTWKSIELALQNDLFDK